MVGVSEIYHQVNSYFEESGVRGTVSPVQFQRFDPPPKLSRAHIYTQARLKLDDLPDVDLKGFVTMAGRIIWHQGIVTNAMRNDQKFLETERDISEIAMVEYILESIPKAILYIQALPP